MSVITQKTWIYFF